MYKRIKYSLFIIVICLLMPLYRNADAEIDKNKKEIDITIGKKINGVMEFGTTDTYVIKPPQVGKLTITITNYINDYTTAYLYADKKSDDILNMGAEYDKNVGYSTIRFDIYVNSKPYYLTLKNQFVINGGKYTISTRFSPTDAVNSDQINNSIDKAVPIYNNKYYLGVIAIDENENYYSIKFKKKTKFSLQVTGKDQATIDITIQDTDGKTIYSDWCYYNTKVFSFDDYLSKGEYNIIIKKGSSNNKTSRRYQMITGSYVAITSINIPSKKTMKTGDTYTFKPTIKPTNATGDYNFSTSNNSVVRVSKTTGKVTAIGKGTATITVTTVDGKITDKCKVTVTKGTPVSKVTLSKTKVTLSPGESINLVAAVSPKNASNKTVKWKSSNEKVATVTSGKVTAKSSGSCKITATVGGKSATASITVKAKSTVTPKPTTKPTPQPTQKAEQILVNSISMQSTLKMAKGDSKTLSVTILPENATDKYLTWSSTDSAVVSVEDGTIQCNKVGSATIIVTTSNGKKAYCTVLVDD